mgnify:FL=1
MPNTFVETITAPEVERHSWMARLRMLTDPPDALVSTIAWHSGDGTITCVNVWDTPDAVGDFYLERVRAVIEADGEPANKPERRGEPVAVYVRHES